MEVVKSLENFRYLHLHVISSVFQSQLFVAGSMITVFSHYKRVFQYTELSFDGQKLEHTSLCLSKLMNMCSVLTGWMHVFSADWLDASAR